MFSIKRVKARTRCIVYVLGVCKICFTVARCLLASLDTNSSMTDKTRERGQFITRP